MVFVIAGVVCSFIVTRLNTMRRTAEAHERAAYDAALTAAINENRAAFLSAMTHNLRTPLASIKAAADTLQSPTAHLDDERASQVLERLRRTAERDGTTVVYTTHDPRITEERT